jgi:replicative DNA helicase
VSIPSVSESAGAGPDLRKSRRPKGDRAGAGCDRLPPHDIQMEVGVIGCCLLEPNTCLADAIAAGIKPEFFYDLRHQSVFENLLAMYEMRQPIDLITLQSWLKDCDELDQIGGIAYLSQMQDAVPSAANLSYYLEKVQEKFKARKLIRVCSEIVGEVYENASGLEAILDDAEKNVLSVRNDGARGSIQTPETLTMACIDEFEFRFNNKGKMTGVATGFADLDKMTNGLQPADLIIIAARPSCGKTALMGGMVEEAAINQKVPVGVFSLEMTAKQLMIRQFSSVSRVNIHSLSDGSFTDFDMTKLVTAAPRIKSSPIYIDDTSGLSIMQLRARARRMHQQYGIKALFVDYLQLLHSTSEQARGDRRIEVGDISKGLKTLAKELNIPLVALCQLNREMEKHKGRQPKLSDLRESGDLEQDADVVGMLWKPDADEDGNSTATDPGDGEAVDLLIAKQRNGPTGTVGLTFLKPYTRFESRAKFSGEDIP